MSVRDFLETFSRLFGTPGPEALGESCSSREGSQFHCKVLARKTQVHLRKLNASEEFAINERVVDPLLCSLMPCFVEHCAVRFHSSEKEQSQAGGYPMLTSCAN